ncbi:MAG: hypothetical protein WC473_01680 [Patescibacteria group bacterium]
MLLKQPIKFFGVAISVVSGLSLFLVLFTPVLAWTGPTNDPPNGNVAAPLNQSTLFSGDVISGRWNTLTVTPDNCSIASLVGWSGTKLVCTSTLPSSGGISGTVNYVSKFTGTNTLGNSSIFDNGNVGINDSAPIATLVVKKPSSVVTATWLRVFDDTKNPEIQLQYSSDVNGHWGIYNNQTEDAFRIWGGGNDRLAIKQNGNIGIGINNPLTRLDVAGVVSSTGLQVNGAITASSLSGSGSRCLQASATGQISATASACGTGGSTGGGVNYGLAGQAAYYPANGTNVTGTSALIIDNANGRVAVGTATLANHRFLIKSANLLGYAMKIVDSSGSIPLLSVIDFGTTAFNAMVGIGVEVPAEMLEVAAPVSAKTARVRITDKVNNPELQLQYGIGNEHWSIYTRNTGISGYPGTADSLNIWGGGVDRATINQAGMVGINNTDPQKRLHIGSGPTYYPASAMAITESGAGAWNPSGDSGIEFSVMGAGNYRDEAGAIGYTASLTNEAARGFDFYVGRTDPSTVHGWGDSIPAMKIRSENAYVGIGTWAPLSSLVVSNHSIVTSRPAIVNKDVFVDINTNTTNYSNGLKWSVGTVTSSQELWWLYRPANSANLVLATGDNTPSNSVVTFLSNGKIGIGTSSPISTLSVVGDNKSPYGITQGDGATLYVKNSHITSGLEFSFGVIAEGYTAGVLGISTGSEGIGVYGNSPGGTGIQGRTENGTAISGSSDTNNGWAGVFRGGTGLMVGRSINEKAGGYAVIGPWPDSSQSGAWMALQLSGTEISQGTYNLLSSPDNTNLYVNRPSGRNIYFRENNADQMILQTGGNVGIGTVAPTQKLDVNGMVRFRTSSGNSCSGTCTCSTQEGSIKYIATGNAGHFCGCIRTTASVCSWKQLDNL